MKAWPVLGITIIQAILLLAHWFIYRTWIDFWFPLGPNSTVVLRIAFLVLAFSFVATALPGFRFSNPPIRVLYTFSSAWLGVANYLSLAALLSWLVNFALSVASRDPVRPVIAGVFFGLAVLTAIYGLLNARKIRLRRIEVRLENLPDSWRGRTAVMVSDLHLGNINGAGFCRRIAERIARLNPDVVFIPGDLFDGSGADPDMLIAPLRKLKPPQGAFFVTGNHEEFGSPKHYIEAVRRAGIRVLSNEKVVVDGLAVLGIPYHDSTFPVRVRGVLGSLLPDASEPSILLLHAPTRLPIVESAGVGLQLSGHTHGGQLFPFTWLTRRIFGKFTHGLQTFGRLIVYTSSGSGTWGPPMRVGTAPELVLMTFAPSASTPS